MELPNKSKALVSPEKITDYLLSETHAVGKSKARYFRSFGFDENRATELANTLLTIAQNEQIVDSETTRYGTKYVIDGEFLAPNGVMIQIRTIWIIEKMQDIPRFITAYPVE
ncbi:MAG TPA: hypothetical protein VFI68_15980 [Anaerolineales bacterium]|nr:hypothetical protein [Anaerolineales bacterium]